MDDTVRSLEVSTCIACGARSRWAACPDGCDDVALDLVDVTEVERAAAAVEGLHARIAALRPVVEALAGDEDEDWAALREHARAALHVTAPPVPHDAEIVAAWGCPRCGRVDAPQPCLGVCVRRPVLMTGAARLRELLTAAADAEAVGVGLSRVVALAARVSPRAGHQDATRAAMRERARAALRGPSASA
jgi:hypothetical protein